MPPRNGMTLPFCCTNTPRWATTTGVATFCDTLSPQSDIKEFPNFIIIEWFPNFVNGNRIVDILNLICYNCLTGGRGEKSYGDPVASGIVGSTDTKKRATPQGALSVCCNQLLINSSARSEGPSYNASRFMYGMLSRTVH